MTTSTVCRLKKSLYGLNQAPRAWNAKVTLRLWRMGFTSSKSDSSFFVRTSQTGPISILLYVDDLVIAGANLGEIRNVKSQLAASFDMKDLQNLHYFLRIEVTRTPEGILISQRHYWVCSSSLGWQTASPSQLLIFGTVMRPDTVPKDCRKPHLFDNHSAESQLPDRPDQSIHVAVQSRTPLVRAKDIVLCQRHKG